MTPIQLAMPHARRPRPKCRVCEGRARGEGGAVSVPDGIDIVARGACAKCGVIVDAFHSFLGLIPIEVESEASHSEALCATRSALASERLAHAATKATLDDVMARAAANARDLESTRERLAGVEAAAGRLAGAVRAQRAAPSHTIRCHCDGDSSGCDACAALVRMLLALRDLDTLRAYDQAGRGGEVDHG